MRELRHLRCFLTVAEEVYFARAAEWLHIEQSPLSCAIKDLEHDLDAQLVERTTRSTQLTWAGQVFLDEAKCMLSAVDQAKASAKAAATGYRGTLRVCRRFVADCCFPTNFIHIRPTLFVPVKAPAKELSSFHRH